MAAERKTDAGQRVEGSEVLGVRHCREGLVWTPWEAVEPC